MSSGLKLNRRGFIAGGATVTAFAAVSPAWARSVSKGVSAKGFGTLSGNDIRLTVAHGTFSVDGRAGQSGSVLATRGRPR